MPCCHIGLYMYHLIVDFFWQGSVISLPEHPLDAVPIRLVCQKMVACDQVEFDDHQNFELLWENVQHVTDYAKINPPTMAKYQQNFHLMIEDVVNNYTHLFTSNENLLLGIFWTLCTHLFAYFLLTLLIVSNIMFRQDLLTH